MNDGPHLSLTAGEYPSAGNAFDLTQCSLEYFSAISPAWLALFQETDLIWGDQSVDEAEYSISLATDIPTALSNLRQRSSLLSQAFGKRWDQSIALFENFFKCPDATHVLFELGNFITNYDDPTELKNELQMYIRSFDKPYLTEQKSFLTRKPIVTKELHWLRDHLKLCTKEPGGDRAWVIFGAGFGCDSQRIDFDAFS